MGKRISAAKFVFYFFTAAVFFLISSTNSTFSQTKGSLRGVVVDSTNGESLPYGNVLIDELKTGASTDSRGYFMIPSIPAKHTYTVIVSYVGYKTKSLKVYISPNKITDITVHLSPSSIQMQTVEKIGQRVIEKNATDIGLQRITTKELEMLPKGVESDIFRSLQYLPGVQSTGDVSARYYVRGSPSNENLVLLNGVPIYNPFHAFGMFSVIDPDMINNVEFYKGGFTAEYGGRLSSILNIITKDGNKVNFGTKLSSSFLTGKALVEGPIPHGSFIATGRKSYSTQILNKFLNDKNAPINFYDLSFKLNYANPDFIKGSKFVIHGFSSSDKLLNKDPQIEDLKWANNILGFRWFQVTDTPLFYEMDMSWSNFTGDVIPKLSKAKPKNNEVNDITLKMNFTYMYDTKDELGIGLSIKDLDTKLYLQNSQGAVSDIGAHGTNLSLFAKYKFLRYENFGADIGTRLNLTGLSQAPGSSFFPEPRVSLTYRIFPQVALKAAWGIYRQELTTLSDENEVISLFEPWIIIPPYLKPATAVHYTIGMKADFTSDLSLDIQGYYKLMHNIPTLNDKKAVSTDPDLVSASGVSYGWEFMARYNHDPISLTASYSLSWAYKDVSGWLYYPRYDVRNAVNLLCEVNLGAGWEASAIWIFNSGLPFTQNMGYYNRFHFQNFYSAWQIYEGYNPFAILADKNLGRLPAYHRLDLSVTKRFVLSFIKFSLDASIINVYNRKNIFYFKRDTGEQVNMLPFLPTATLKIEL